MTTLVTPILTWFNTIRKLTNQERDECDMFLALCHKRQLRLVCLPILPPLRCSRFGNLVDWLELNMQ